MSPIQSPTSKNCHKHKVTNINMSPKSMLPLISFEPTNYNGLIFVLLQAANQQKCVLGCLTSIIVSRYSIVNEFLIQIVRRWNQPKFARNFRYDAIEMCTNLKLAEEIETGLLNEMILFWRDIPKRCDIKLFELPHHKKTNSSSFEINQWDG